MINAENQAEKLEERMLVEGGCLVAGKVYEQSERWNGDECTICTCQVITLLKQFKLNFYESERNHEGC